MELTYQMKSLIKELACVIRRVYKADLRPYSEAFTSPKTAAELLGGAVRYEDGICS